MSLKNLPIEGELLKEIVIYGNAKDCEITIKTKNSDREIQFLMRDPKVQIDARGKIRSIIFEDGGDPYLGVKYLPLENLKLLTCVVEFHDDHDDQWQEVLQYFQDGVKHPVGWMIDSASIKLIPWLQK